VNKNQLIAAVIGLVVAFGVYFIKFILPIAKLKQKHPEIFATNPPNAVVGGLSGTLLLLGILAVTGIAIFMFRGKT